MSDERRKDAEAFLAASCRVCGASIEWCDGDDAHECAGKFYRRDLATTRRQLGEARDEVHKLWLQRNEAFSRLIDYVCEGGPETILKQRVRQLLSGEPSTAPPPTTAPALCGFADREYVCDREPGHDTWHSDKAVYFHPPTPAPADPVACEPWCGSETPRGVHFPEAYLSQVNTLRFCSPACCAAGKPRRAASRNQGP